VSCAKANIVSRRAMIGHMSNHLAGDTSVCCCSQTTIKLLSFPFNFQAPTNATNTKFPTKNAKFNTFCLFNAFSTETPSPSAHSVVPMVLKEDSHSLSVVGNRRDPVVKGDPLVLESMLPLGFWRVRRLRSRQEYRGSSSSSVSCC